MNSAIRIVAAVALAGAAFAANASISDKIEAPAGEISGNKTTNDRNVVAFLGIPYAAPPVAENRWRPPQPVDLGKKFKADAYGAQCMQTLTTAGFGRGFPGGGRGNFTGQIRGGGGFGGGGGGFGGGRGGFGGGGFGGGFRPGGGPVQTSEDCLTLNIWSGAESEGAKRPVMVFVHGDELRRGAASDARYNGEILAGRGIVVVSFNYRLGALGFLAHPALSSEGGGSSGNYGLMDAVAALEWVKDNISAFGGDPGNVTVFSSGEGATMAAALIGSPAAKGLFQKAILESGSWMGTGVAKMKTLADAESEGAQLVNDRFGGVSIDELREMSADQFAGVMTDPEIIVDGKIVPDDLSKTFANGKQNHVDVIVGSNREEGITLHERSNVRTDAEYEADVRARFGGLADEVLRMYPGGNDEAAAASNVTELGDELAWELRLLARRQHEIGRKGYVYEFTRVPPQMGAQAIRGSTRGAEIQYVFDNMGAFQAWTDGDRRLAQVMASYWINFAETGDPTGMDRFQESEVALPTWPVYTGSEEFQTMEFGDRIGTNPWWQISREKLELFDKLYAALVPTGKR